MADPIRNSVLLVCASLLVSMSACSGDSPEPDAPAPTDAVIQAPPPAVTPSAAGDTALISDTAAQPSEPVRQPSQATVESDVPSAPRPAQGSSPGASPGALPGALPGSAQGSDEGARILTRMASKYETVRSLTADFVMRVENPLLRTKTEGRGKLYQQRPDRIALRFTRPAGEVILSDGQYFWMYLPSTYEDQVFRSPAAAAGSRVVDLQAQFVGDPVKRFSYTQQGTETVGGRATDVLMLIPRGQAQYRSLKVWVDREDALVRRFEFVESSGVIRHVDLTGVRINPVVPADMFKFTVPAGVRVVAQ